MSVAFAFWFGAAWGALIGGLAVRAWGDWRGFLWWLRGVPCRILRRHAWPADAPYGTHCSRCYAWKKTGRVPMLRGTGYHDEPKETR